MPAPIHQEVLIDGDRHAIYEILMDSKKHTQLTGGAPAEISREVGGAFTCHGGAILGRNVELVEDKLIVQSWRVANWDESVNSVVRIELKDADNGTLLVLDHSGFPEGEGEHLAEGWNNHYWTPMKELVAS